MDVAAVRIEGYHEVLALHRFLFECKGDELASVYAGSPFIAAVQNRLADALEAADPGTGRTEWRGVQQHTQRVDDVRRHLLSAGSWWNDMTREQRTDYVRDLLAPLRVPDDILADLTELPAQPAPNPAAACDWPVRGKP